MSTGIIRCQQAVCETPQTSEEATVRGFWKLTKEQGMTPPDSPEGLH